MQYNEMPPQARKRVWYILFFAFVVSIGLYGLIAFMIQQSRSAPASAEMLQTLRPIFYALAGVSLLASILWAQFKMRVRVERVGEASLLSPAEFQTATIIALALAESCSIFGLVLFFLGATMEEFLWFAVANIALDLLVLLPLGNRYWAAWEREQQMKT